MRKRSKYRPKEVRTNAVEWAIAGTRSVSCDKDTMFHIGVKNHLALEQLRTGNATRTDMALLIDAMNMAEALAVVAGLGGDLAGDFLAAMLDLKDIAEKGLASGRFVATGPQLRTIVSAMELHDSQLEHPACSVRVMETCVRHVKQVRATGKGLLVIRTQQPQTVNS